MALTKARPFSAQPDEYALPTRSDDDRSDHPHRQIIGFIGLLLPLILIVLVLLRDGMKQWRNLDSISAYYYSGAIVPFAGMLVALALFLFTYRGYENKYEWADWVASNTAAVAALGVALFPTAAPEGVTALIWWRPYMGVIHHVSAMVLFGMFAVFALWLFRMPFGAKTVLPKKSKRNKIYLVCGLVIVASMAWAIVEGLNDRSIFWPESVALVAFAVSWLVKGRVSKASIIGSARKFVDTTRVIFRREGA